MPAIDELSPQDRKRVMGGNADAVLQRVKTWAR